MAAADLADVAEVLGGRHQGAGRNAADRFDDEGQHILRAQFADLGVQCAGAFDGMAFPAVAAGQAIAERCRDGVGGDGKPRHEGSQGVVAADGQRGQRGAVVGGHQGNHASARCLAAGQGILAQELEGIVDRFAAPRGEIDALESGPGQGREAGGVVQVRPVSGDASIGVVEFPGLRRHGLDDPRVAVPDGTDHGPRRGIDIFLAVFVPHMDPRGPLDHRQRHAGRTCIVDILRAARRPGNGLLSGLCQGNLLSINCHNCIDIIDSYPESKY